MRRGQKAPRLSKATIDALKRQKTTMEKAYATARLERNKYLKMISEAESQTTLQEVGDVLGITRQRVYQLRNEAS